LEKDPPNSITTWNDLVSKFVNRFFPPSKTTNLRNEITRFQQRFGETFAKAWDRFKDLHTECPIIGFTPLHQIDTFYNSLNQSEHDSLNSAAGGNFLTKNTQEALTIIENKSKVQTSRNKPQVASTSGSSTQDAALTALTKQVEALVLMNRPIISIRNGCETCGGPHPYYECQAAGGHTQDVYATLGTYNQGGNAYQPQGMLLSNTVPNPQEDLKAITARSGVTLAGPSVPPPPLSSSKKVERDPKSITDQLPPTPASSFMIPEQNPHQPPIPYPSRLNKDKLQDKSDIQIHSFLQMFKKLYFNISLAEALAHMPMFAKMVKDLLTNKGKLLELANIPLNENCSVVLLKKLPENLETLRGSLFLTLSLPELTPTRELATQTIAYLAGIADDVFVQVGKFTFPADFVVVDYDVDPRVPLILGRPFLRTAHALVDVHGEELTLRIDIHDITCDDHFHEVLNVQKAINLMSGSPTPSSDPMVASLSPSLTPFVYSDFILEEIDTFLASDDSTSPDDDDGTFDIEGDIRLTKILLNNDISNDLLPPLLVFVINETEKIKSSIDDPPDLELKDLTPHLEYAFLEGTSKLPVIIAKYLKREEKEQLLKVLKSRKRVITWKISNIRGIDPNFCTHKILMEDDFKPAVQHQRRMLERLAGNEYYCFLDGFSGYFQIPIDPQDQEKTTFTCPYGTFAYQRMPFGLCNAPRTFQRCMVAIFHDMIEKTIEVFMDDFSVFRDSFSSCLSYLDMMLKWCEDTNLVLNWEKCHFMVKEGIVLGRKISKNEIEVDKAKVDVISKLPSPPPPRDTVKGIGSSGHVGFYRGLSKTL
ncbi:reverse transcriptase domain-containing protein, partial [Tanacetum coccineum]